MGSCPICFIVTRLPTANGPWRVTVSIDVSQRGQVSRSVRTFQTASGARGVSAVCSCVHMSAPPDGRVDNLCTDYLRADYWSMPERNMSWRADPALARSSIEACGPQTSLDEACGPQTSLDEACGPQTSNNGGMGAGGRGQAGYAWVV